MTSSDINICFLGAAGTVTGSKYLIKTDTKSILIDCGMFQGVKELRELNWKKLPFDESTIDLILLTHGHLDHTGYLPRLVKNGFSGAIWATAPTIEITKIILEDSARIQEEDAERANREGFSKHDHAEPLYSCKDVENVVPLFAAQSLNSWIKIDTSISCRFLYSGHILGATSIELKIGNKIIVFSGDIGRENDLLMYPPVKPEHADIVIIESTYGNRLHPDDASDKLEALVNSCFSSGGTLIIPSFAVERTQTLMYLLWLLKKENRIPAIPIYMDSPMGTSILSIFEQTTSWHKLSASECQEMCRDIKLIHTIQETRKLAASKASKIIIAGSGMASGGRVLSYFAEYIGNPNATILLVGYQAEGTRGRNLLDGADQLKLFG
ncbi:MAG TPA: MBL fold metallo-hydrolase, partial [Bacteroidia bacterium]|nr:MBL fold metallo-hydrolase [Bacteroidia bacterium]